STSGGSEVTEEDEIQIVQKLVKQRKDSATIFIEQGRQDLADPELAQIAVIEQFLPEQLSEEEVADVEKLIEKIEEDDDVQNVYHTMEE
uniref:GatB/YqeY domain-containing protein n=1 Tax=Mesonia mobilis TaxID=369791 RepID=UPI0026F07591